MKKILIAILTLIVLLSAIIYATYGVSKKSQMAAVYSSYGYGGTNMIIGNTTGVNAGRPRDGVIKIRNVREAQGAISLVSDINTKNLLNLVVKTYTPGIESSSPKDDSMTAINKNPKIRIWPRNTVILILLEKGFVSSIGIQTPFCMQNYQSAPLSIKIKTAYDVERLLKDGGVCTIMSTVYSVIKTFSLPVSVYSSDGGKIFKKDFINQFPNSVDTEIDPMTNTGLKEMHEKFEFNNETFKCEQLVFPRGGTEADLKKLCSDINDRISKRFDCSVAMSAPFEGVGHAVNYTKVKWNNDTKRCETEVAGTDRLSGNGSMTDVPTKPLAQTWDIGLDANSIGGLDFIPKETGGKNKIWEDANYNSGTFYCCAKINVK